MPNWVKGIRGWAEEGDRRMMLEGEIREWIGELEDEIALWKAKREQPAPFPFFTNDRDQICAINVARREATISILRIVLGEESR